MIFVLGIDCVMSKLATSVDHLDFQISEVNVISFNYISICYNILINRLL